MYENDAIVSGLFAIAAAIFAVSYQYWQFRRQINQSNSDRIADSKKKVIEKLISYRFVLTTDQKIDPQSTAHFNAALSSIPVHFSHSKSCMDCYRDIGNNFTSDKFYYLILALMTDIPLGTDAIDKYLLENVPRVTPRI